MQSQRQKIRLQLSEQAERYVRADAPRDARLMAARGALPLQPVELASVLFALMHDSDAEVKSTARDSLESLPPPVMASVLSAPIHPAILDHLAQAFPNDERHLETIALNPSSSDTTIAFIASRPLKNTVEIISNNQERMLRCPAIVDALGDNPLTGRAVIDRILSFLGMEERDDDVVDPDAIGDAEARAALEAVLGENFEDDGANLFSLIQNMSVFQKIKLGRMGNKEARGLLVRDRNKVVAISAVTSPKITDNELIAIAKSRSVCDEVIRIIANNRELTRIYQVKLALATNPKTPQGTSMKFVNYLQERDLRAIMKSKDVPTAVSTHARRILTKKGKL
jgi:hypothetical protein